MATFYELDSFRRDRQNYPNPLDYTVSPDLTGTWTAQSRSIRSLSTLSMTDGCNKKASAEDVFRTVNVGVVTLPYPRIELFALDSVDVSSVSANIFTSPDSSGLANGDVVMTSSTNTGLVANTRYYVIGATGTTFQLSLTPGGAAFSVADRPTGTTFQLPVVVAADLATVMGNLDRARLLLDFPRIYLDLHSSRYNDTRAIRTIGGVLTAAKFVLVIDRIQNDASGAPVWIHYRSSSEQTMRFRLEDPIVVAFYSRGDTIIDFFAETDFTVMSDPKKQSLITIEVTPYSRDNSFRGEPLDE